MGRGCVELPGLREALGQGRIDFSAAREIVKVARPHDVQEWIEKGARLTAAQLRAEVQGGEPIYLRSYGFSGEQLAWVEDALTLLRKELGTAATKAELLAELCRRALGSKGGAGPVVQTIFMRCPDCDETWRQTSEGAVPVDQASADAALCDGEVVDLQSGEVERRIPTPTRRKIEKRHGGRCAVPGCRNRIIEAHHEDGWRRGHGPERCLPLCPAHHKQRHQGWLTLALADGRWTFFRKDGTWLGKAGDDHKATDEARTSPRDFERRVSPPLSHAIKAEERGLDFARAKGSRAEVDAAAQVVPVRPTPSVSPAPGELSAVTSSAAVEVPAEARVDPADLMRDAVSALRGLELRKREAEGLVRLALASEPEREWSLGDLIGQALRSMPTRHLTG